MVVCRLNTELEAFEELVKAVVVTSQESREESPGLNRTLALLEELASCSELEEDISEEVNGRQEVSENLCIEVW